MWCRVESKIINTEAIVRWKHSKICLVTALFPCLSVSSGVGSQSYLFPKSRSLLGSEGPNPFSLAHCLLKEAGRVHDSQAGLSGLAGDLIKGGLHYSIRCEWCSPQTVSHGRQCPGNPMQRRLISVLERSSQSWDYHLPFRGTLLEASSSCPVNDILEKQTWQWMYWWKHWRIYQSKLPPAAQLCPSWLPVFNPARFLSLQKVMGWKYFPLKDKWLGKTWGGGQWNKGSPWVISSCGQIGWDQRVPASDWECLLLFYFYTWTTLQLEFSPGLS